MKDETSVTLMVCTAADGSKILLAMDGKAVNPRCFELAEGK